MMILGVLIGYAALAVVISVFGGGWADTCELIPQECELIIGDEQTGGRITKQYQA